MVDLQEVSEAEVDLTVAVVASAVDHQGSADQVDLEDRQEDSVADLQEDSAVEVDSTVAVASAVDHQGLEDHPVMMMTARRAKMDHRKEWEAAFEVEEVSEGIGEDLVEGVALMVAVGVVWEWEDLAWVDRQVWGDRRAWVDHQVETREREASAAAVEAL